MQILIHNRIICKTWIWWALILLKISKYILRMTACISLVLSNPIDLCLFYHFFFFLCYRLLMVVYYCISLLHWLYISFSWHERLLVFILLPGVPPYFNVHVHRESGESIPVVPEVPSRSAWVVGQIIREWGPTEVRTLDLLIQLLLLFVVCLNLIFVIV